MPPSVSTSQKGPPRPVASTHSCGDRSSLISTVWRPHGSRCRYRSSLGYGQHRRPCVFVVRASGTRGVLHSGNCRSDDAAHVLKPMILVSSPPRRERSREGSIACRRWGSASAVSVRSSAASHPPIDLEYRSPSRLLLSSRAAQSGRNSRHGPQDLAPSRHDRRRTAPQASRTITAPAALARAQWASMPPLRWTWMDWVFLPPTELGLATWSAHSGPTMM